MLWLLQLWHVPRCQLTSGLMVGAVAGGEVSERHLSLEPQRIGTRKK
jgi:hypothetical protein